jgi:hypothetical protein
MPREELGIEERESALDHTRGEMDQRHFARIALAREHALAEECSAEAHTIEPPHQLSVPPAFDAVGVAPAMKRRIDLRDLGVDPTVVATGSRFGAGADHLGEGCIGGDPETVAPDGAGKTVGDVKAIERKDAAALGRYPEEQRVVAPFRHGKYALRVSPQQ